MRWRCTLPAAGTTPRHRSAAGRLAVATRLRRAVTGGVVETLGADAYLYGTAKIGGCDADVIARIGSREHVGMGDTVPSPRTPTRFTCSITVTGARVN